MKHCFELPPTAEATAPGFTARLNDIFRRIQEAVERLAGGKATGDLDMGGYRVVNLANPRLSADAVPLAYLEGRLVGVKAAPPAAQAAIAPTVTQTALLAVPGVLAIQSDAAPVVTLATESVVKSVEALLKRAPTGADLTCKVLVDGADWATVTVKDGETTGTVANPAGLAPIGAGKAVRLDLTEVGTTFPGADLSLLIRFSG